MPPDGVIEPVDVSGDGVFGLLAGLPCNRPDQLRLDGLEERFHHRVVVAVSAPTHRDQDAAFAEQRLIVDRAVLRPAVGMVDEPRARANLAAIMLHRADQIDDDTVALQAANAALNLELEQTGEVFRSARHELKTLSQSIQIDPVTGIANMSYHRSMRHARQALATSLHSRGHLWRMLQTARERGEELRVAMVVGAGLSGPGWGNGRATAVRPDDLRDDHVPVTATYRSGAQVARTSEGSGGHGEVVVAGVVAGADRRAEIEAGEQFVEAGGESLQLVPCLNDHPSWVTALKTLSERAPLQL